MIRRGEIELQGDENNTEVNERSKISGEGSEQKPVPPPARILAVGIGIFR